jgi:hypothetical protein
MPDVRTVGVGASLLGHCSIIIRISLSFLPHCTVVSCMCPILIHEATIHEATIHGTWALHAEVNQWGSQA